MDMDIAISITVQLDFILSPFIFYFFSPFSPYLFHAPSLFHENSADTTQGANHGSTIIQT